MVSIIECSVLSASIYNIKKTQPLVGIISSISSPDILISTNGWYIVTDVSPKTKPSNPFFAALYIKFHKGVARETVVAIRGTHNFDNIMVDINSWISDVLGDDGRGDVIPSYLHQATRFFVDSLKYLKKYFPQAQRPVLTGHSLGGALAKLIVLKNGYGFPVVAFNAPGVGHMPGVSTNNLALIKNINAKNGLINKVGLTLDMQHNNIFWVDISEEGERAHKMIAQFDANEYQRGQLTESFADQSKDAPIPIAFKVPTLLTEKAIASFEKTDAILSANKAIKHDYKFKQAQKKCLSDIAEGFVALEACRFTVTVKQDAHIILAQHSIDNMIRALQKPQYVMIAQMTPYCHKQSMAA